MMKKYILGFLFATLLPMSALAQRTARVEGEYTLAVNLTDNITLFQARQRAIELAKNDAIKREFGETVASDFVGGSAEVDGQQVSSFAMENTGTSAKGDWLGDRKPAEISVEYDGDNEKLYITAHVWGEAREIVQSQIEISAITMRNGANGLEAATQFRQGERFFIDFKSPVDGYLAVYLVENYKEVSCLLPYDNKNPMGRFSVRGGQQYTLFDKSSDPQARYYKLSTQRNEERFQLVVIFSPNPFTKCIDSRNDPLHPNSLSYTDFQAWMLRNKRSDRDMVVSNRWVKVVNSTANNQ